MTTRGLFEVDVDGTAISTPRGEDIASLSVGFFCMSVGPANLHIGGLRSRNGAAEHTDMVTRRIPVGSLMTVTYLESHRPPPPLSPERLLEDVKKLEEKYEQHFGGNNLVQPSPPPKHDTSLHTRTFEVKIPDRSQRVSAALDKHAQLQASLYWVDGRCTFRVQSVFVEEDGTPTGEDFITIELQPRQQVAVALVT